MLILLAGCGGKPTASGVLKGKISYKGQPVNNAALQLIQTTGQGDMINVPVNQEGTFSVGSVPAGEYIVVVIPSSGGSPMHMPKDLDSSMKEQAQAKVEASKTTATIAIPEKYKLRLKTDLRLTVTGGEQTQNFELKD